jgi:hypothetical protein
MGSADVRAYSRNKSGIAGSLIWINFDRHALLVLFHKAGGQFVADIDEIRPQYTVGSNTNANSLFTSSVTRGATGPSVSQTIDALDKQVTDIYGMNVAAEPWYSDQILPFDVTLAGSNEYGAVAAAKIFGVEILNEGSGISIDDAVTEMQATLVARAIVDQGNPALLAARRLWNRLPQDSALCVSRLCWRALHGIPAVANSMCHSSPYKFGLTKPSNCATWAALTPVKLRHSALFSRTFSPGVLVFSFLYRKVLRCFCLSGRSSSIGG